ncbi:MAG: FAD-dependent oxidoreductase, partial [Phenylobacterium sp.]|nr:FAD-dependent oxidoreductase [Phenylobacterium sp.]
WPTRCRSATSWPTCRCRRFAKIAQADLFEPGALGLLSPDQASGRVGEATPAALDQTSALVVDPACILKAWIGAVSVARVAALRPDGDGWVLCDAQGETIGTADAVILANALSVRDLVADMSLSPVRGQASWTTDGARSPALAWGGYVLPTRDGVLFGATHDRDDTRVDVRNEDHARNLELLSRALPRLAAGIDATRLVGRASIRAVTPDRLPLAGATAGDSRLYVLAGFGSRGFSFAPLLAEHVAAQILGAPSPIGAAAAELLDPGRFMRRSARRS